MRLFFIILISSFLFSCNFNQSKNTGASSMTQSDSIIDPEKVMKMKLTNTNEYRKVLDHLDQGELTSLDAASTLFKNSVADSLARDSMFVVFSDFYNSFAGSYLENNEDINMQLEKSPSSELVKQLRSSLSAFGILLLSSEGKFYLEPQTEYLLNNFGPELSSAYRAYLTIGSKEQKERFAEDGTILISSDSLTSRIMTWDNFIAKYPDFISIKMAQDQYAQYMGAYLAGMDNSRIFDPASNLLNESSKVSFESFILKNPECNSTEIVKAYLDLLKSTNFNYTDRVDSFLIDKVYH